MASMEIIYIVTLTCTLIHFCGASTFYQTPTYFNHSYMGIEYVNSTLYSTFPVGTGGIQHIILSNNNIQRLEQNAFTIVRSNTTFAYFYNCWTLDLSYNQLTFIHPQAFNLLQNLQNLLLNNNHLTDLPSGIISLNINLALFNVSYNQISHIGNTVFNKNHDVLRDIDISFNKIASFEPWPFLIPQKNKFNLSHNEIENFTNVINWSYNLVEPFTTRVNLQFNKFVQWRDEYIQQYNPIGDVADDLPTYNLDLRNNAWLCDCHLHHIALKFRTTFLIQTNEDWVHVKCASPPQLYGKEILYEIDLKDFRCNVTENCPDGCSCQRRTEEQVMFIDCENTGKTVLPEKLPALQGNEKYVINMNKNNIKRLSFVNYIKMTKELRLRGSNLQEVSVDFMEHVDSLKHLDLSYNRLNYLPERIQRLSFQEVNLQQNPLVCECNMTWMADWIKLSPFYTPGRDITCQYENKQKYKIIDVTDKLLKCDNDIAIALAVIFGALLVLVIVAAIWAKRCPYETKVLLFRFFRIHPGDKYMVDRDLSTDNMTYVIYDDENIHIRQWVAKRLCKRLEEEKPFYKLFVPYRDAQLGDDRCSEIITNIERSRRIIIILSEGMEVNEWTLFEVQRAEILPNIDGRILFIKYHTDLGNMLEEEPWSSRIKGRKVLVPGETRSEKRWFWMKLKYELPLATDSSMTGVESINLGIQT